MTGDAKRSFYFNSILYEAKRAAERGEVNEFLMNELETFGNAGLLWYDALTSRAAVVMMNAEVRSNKSDASIIVRNRHALQKCSTQDSIAELFKCASDEKQRDYVVKTRNLAYDGVMFADRLLARIEGMRMNPPASLFARMRRNIGPHFRKHQDPRSLRGAMKQ